MIFEGVEKALEPQTFTSPKVSQNPYNSESYTLRHREIRRADLYRQFELAAFSPAPIPVVAPNELDLPEDN
jgi:hypothetical protein